MSSQQEKIHSQHIYFDDDHNTCPIEKQNVQETHEAVYRGDSDSLQTQDFKEGTGVHKQQFRNLFGLQLDIPAFYVLDGRFYPGDLDYQIIIVKFQMPEGSMHKFVTHKYGNGYYNYPPEQDWNEFCSRQKYDSLQLFLLKNVNSCLNVVSKIKIAAQEQVNIEFSADSKFMAIFYIEDLVLEFYEIMNQDIIRTLEMVKERKYTYIIQSDQFHGMVFNKIQFSNQYFALFGPKHACIVDMYAQNQPRICSKYFLDTAVFTDILDLNVAQGSKNSDIIKCEVACLVRDFNKVHVFSIFNPNHNFVRKGSKSLAFKDPSLREHIPDVKVKISEDFNQVLLAYKNENYVIRRDKASENGHFEQRNLKYLTRKKIRYISTSGCNFFFVCCKEYDKNLDVISSKSSWSTREKIYKIGLDRGILPNSVRTFDLKIFNNPNPNEKNNDGTFIHQKMMVMSTLDQQLFVDNINLQSDDIINKWVTKRDPIPKPQPSYQYYSIKFEQGGSFCSTWPYITFEGVAKGFMWIINLNKPEIIHRLQLPPDCIEVVDTEITATFELMIMCQAMLGERRQQQGYKLLEVDLDCYKDPETQYQQQFWIKPIFSFSKDEVIKLLLNSNNIEQNQESLAMPKRNPDSNKRGQFQGRGSLIAQFDAISEYDILEGMRLLDMFIRSSNSKDKGSQNQKLIVFVLFTGFVLSFVQGRPGQNGQPLQFVCFTDATQFKRLDESSFIMDKKMDPKDEKMVVYKVEINYSSYTLSTFFEKQFQNEKMISYSIDNKTNMLIILSKIKVNSVKTKFRQLRIIDLSTQKCIFKNEMTAQMSQVTGRMKSGDFVLHNGHMYFDNTVVKIRYDLIQKGIFGAHEPMTDEQVFDVYDKILDLEHDESIMISYPYQGWRSHKIIYVIHQNHKEFPSIYKDDDRFIHKKVVIMPYLHERKIHVGRFKEDHQYFCLAIDDKWQKHSILEQAKIPEFQQDPRQMAIWEGFKKKIMVNINFTTKKLYAYKYNGLLTQRCVFKDLAEKFGQPEAVSGDGLNFLFVKRKMRNTFLTVLRLNLDNSKGFEILTKFEQINLQKVERNFLKTNHFRNSQTSKSPRVDMKFDINCEENTCQFDIAVCMSYQGKSSIFLLVDHKKDDMVLDWKWVDDHFNSKDELQVVKNFSINRKFIVYWTDYEIFYKEIANLSKMFVKIDLPIKPSKETNSWVHSVYTGDADEKIAIMIKTKGSDGSNYLITWQTNQQKEIDAFEIPEDTKVFFDQKGDIYATHKNQVLICSQKVRLTCFQTDYLQTSYREFGNVQKMGLSKGHHIDHEFHRWIFLHEFILLPYSYMTFAIKQKLLDLKTYDHPDFIFDIEQFNFIMDKLTPFTFDEKNCLNYKYMSYLLENMELYDPVLLDLLQYFDQEAHVNQAQGIQQAKEILSEAQVPQSPEKAQSSPNLSPQAEEQIFNRGLVRSATQIKKMGSFMEKGVMSAAKGAAAGVGNVGSFVGSMFQHQEQQYKMTPLHIATHNNESKIKELILKYMSKIAYKNENAFIDIFPQFLIQPGFLEYFDSLQFQTQALKLKQKLRVKRAYDEKFIIKMNIQNCSYFDENFFKNKLDEIQIEDTKKQNSEKVIKNFDVDIQAMRVDWIVGQEEGKLFLQSMIQCENPEIYNNKAITILINYLFSKFKYKILFARLPLYAGQIATFILAMMLDDQVYIDGYIRAPKPTFLLVGFWVLLVIVLANMGVMLYQIYRSYQVYFNQAWNYYEICYIFLVFYIAVNKLILYYRCTDKEDTRNWKRVEEFRNHHTQEMEQEDELLAKTGQGLHCVDIQRTNRKLEALLALIVWFKVLFFLQLSDRFAPLVQVIYAIVWQIRWFAGIVLIILAAFANAFFILGLNQMAHDGIPVGSHPVYSTIKGSIIYIFKLVAFLDPGLDNFTRSARTPPQNSMYFYLWLFWIVGVFVMIIHLLNMLIGMMGNIQGEETAKRQMYSLKYKLNVVVDNWWINAIDPKGLKYIISATKCVTDQEEEIHNYYEKKKEIDILREQIKKQMKNEVAKIKVIQELTEN